MKLPVNPIRISKDKFSTISISLASSEEILSWSSGEIKKPETINYRTFKPENDGLFCAKIFGPVKDYECLCGKYKRMRYRGMVCEKCGVEVILSKVRRERMGHIVLEYPVVHVWFMKYISILLDIPTKTLESIIYFENHIILDPGLTPLYYGQIISEEQLDQLYDDYGEDNFQVNTGTEAIYKLLKSLDLKKVQEELQAKCKLTNSELKLKKLNRQLRLVEDFIKSGNRPEWMIINVLPVLPPELRPLVALDGGRFATSDLNELYHKVINRNNRLKYMKKLKAPQIVINNEIRMLHHAVSHQIDNSQKNPILSSNKHPLKSLADMLKGKQGIFRQNLLGKRVDYSGRSVIVVGPSLQLHQCGLPKDMALELFKPYVYAKLQSLGKASTLKLAKKIVERKKSEVWDILDDVVRQRPVLLNRAPTLHRLSIQAFEPILVEGSAIHLHPLVCAAFNADFDGDQMAVHVPLSFEAQIEARVLMMANNNVLSPASGKPIIVPTQDIVLGLYYLTLNHKDEKNNKLKYFDDIMEIENALNMGNLKLHDSILYSYQTVDNNDNIVFERYETTSGRAILSQLLPKNSNISFDLVNCICDKKQINDIVASIYRYCSHLEIIEFCDQIMKIGFHYASKSGISFGKDDMTVPGSKDSFIKNTRKQVELYDQQWLDGLITQDEKYNKTIEAWSQCTDHVEADMTKSMSELNRHNSAFMMWHSGARGSSAQMKQLAGMRGLIAKPSGEIIETPITSNFREGLSVLEYFNSTHGARKGLADTALKTANSGYLTRRLVDSAQDCIIYEHDCGSTDGIYVANIIEGKTLVSSLKDRIMGRVLAEDIIHPITSEVIVSAGEMIMEDYEQAIFNAGVNSVKVRTVLACKAKHGVCIKCYGCDLSKGRLVDIGEAVGIIAAQSIGEPGTQLTMRTFHIGGTAKVMDESTIDASYAGKVILENLYSVIDKDGYKIVLSRNCKLIIVDNKGNRKSSYHLQYGTKLLVNDQDEITIGQKLAQKDPYTIPVITELSGKVKYDNFVEGITFFEEIDKITGISNKIITISSISRKKGLKPSILILDENDNLFTLPNGNEARYHLSEKAIVSVEDGSRITIGTILARIPREGSRTHDITGGLPRVVELFEARNPKDAAVLVKNDGIVSFSREHKNKNQISIILDDSSKDIYNISLDKHIVVQDGDYVKKGDYLVNGTPSLCDILDNSGVISLAEFFINEVQKVYRLQGVQINDKHIEVILHQMLQNVEIIESGDTIYMVGDHIDKEEIDRCNSEMLKQDKQPAKYKRILLGITKANLQTKSFISAAAFQDTMRVLTESALAGKKDYLVGMKENVIVGRLIPAGTGLAITRIKSQTEAS